MLKILELLIIKRFLAKLRIQFTFPKEGKGDRLRWMSMRFPKENIAVLGDEFFRTSHRQVKI